MLDYTVIVTKNNSDYINWQTDILYESFLKFHKNDINFKFLALVSKDYEYKIEPKYQYLYFKHTEAINNDNYIVYNRILNLSEYLKSVKPSKHKFIILLDPDFIFIKKFDIKINKNVLGQNYSYLDNKKAVQYFIENFNQGGIQTKDFYQPVGCPIVISEYLLSKIVDRWLELTIQFRSDLRENSPFYRNWVCEMYALAFVLAENKIKIENFDITGCVPYVTNCSQYYFYHYCYHIPSKKNSKKIIFDKKSYNFRELKFLPTNTEELNECSLEFFEQMNNYIKILKNEKEIRSLGIIKPQILPTTL